MFGQCHANFSTQVQFVICGCITYHKLRRNYLFSEGVNILLKAYSDSVATDFITILDAQEQVIKDLGIAVSHSTLARWVALHDLGHKLEGAKGQWIVNSKLFNKFLIEKPLNRKSKLWDCP